MWRTSVAVGFALLGAFLASAQPSPYPIPQIQLRAGDRISVPSLPISGGGTGPIRCDMRGNVYMRPVSPKANGLLAPVVRISTDGQTTTVFDVSTVSEVKAASVYEIYDFAVRKDGAVLQLVAMTSKDEQAIVAIIEMDGEDKSSSFVSVDSQLAPRQIGPLPSGMFLISGLRRSTRSEGGRTLQSSTPFVAIFDSRGKLVRELHLAEDVKVPDIDTAKPDNPDTSGMRAVDLSQLVVSDDGTAYFLRAGKPPRIFAISSTGEVISSYLVPVPSEDASTPSIMYASGRLAFDFFVPAGADDPRMNLTIRVVDAQTGQVFWDYVPAKEIYGIPACYSGQDFTFLQGTADRRLAFLKVSPR